MQFNSSLMFLTGRYGENLHRLRDMQSGPALLMQTLAWAVSHGIPLHQAVLNQTETGVPLSCPTATTIEAFLSPVIPFYNPDSWNRQLRLLANDLLVGDPLALALRKQMRGYIPESLITIIEKAETDGNLERILPCLAERLKLISGIRTSSIWLLRPILIEFSIIIILVFFLSRFIFPRLGRILAELTDSLFSISSFYPSNTYTTLMTGLVLAILAMVWIRVICALMQWDLRNIIVNLLSYVPGISGFFRRQAILEMSSAMGVYLAAGEDLVKAAEFSRDSCRFRWLKKRLNRFVSELEAGIPWGTAWEHLRLDIPLGNWIIRNAAVTEDPTGGFDNLTEVMTIDLLRFSRSRMKKIEFILVIFNALIVGLIAYNVFFILSSMMQAVLNETGI